MDIAYVATDCCLWWLCSVKRSLVIVFSEAVTGDVVLLPHRLLFWFLPLVISLQLVNMQDPRPELYNVLHCDSNVHLDDLHPDVTLAV